MAVSKSSALADLSFSHPADDYLCDAIGTLTPRTSLKIDSRSGDCYLAPFDYPPAFDISPWAASRDLHDPHLNSMCSALAHYGGDRSLDNPNNHLPLSIVPTHVHTEEVTTISPSDLESEEIQPIFDTLTTFLSDSPLSMYSDRLAESNSALSSSINSDASMLFDNDPSTSDTATSARWVGAHTEDHSVSSYDRLASDTGSSGRHSNSNQPFVSAGTTGMPMQDPSIFPGNRIAYESPSQVAGFDSSSSVSSTSLGEYRTTPTSSFGYAGAMSDPARYSRLENDDTDFEHLREPGMNSAFQAFDTSCLRSAGFDNMAAESGDADIQDVDGDSGSGGDERPNNFMRQSSGGSPQGCSNLGPHRKIRHKCSPEQVTQLTAFFEHNRNPTGKVRQELAQRLGMPERSVQIWFQNKKARSKKKDDRKRLTRAAVETEEPATPEMYLECSVLKTKTKSRKRTSAASVRAKVKGLGSCQSPAAKSKKRPTGSPSSLTRTGSNSSLLSLGSTSPPSLPAARKLAKSKSLLDGVESLTFIPAFSLSIGSWRRLNPLTCFFSRNVRTLTWSLKSDSVGFKLDCPWSSISSITFDGPFEPSMSELAEKIDGPLGLMCVKLERPPTFLMEIFRSASKPGEEVPSGVRWRQCQDLTEGKQATHVLTHVLSGPFQAVREAVLKLKKCDEDLASRIHLQDEVTRELGTLQAETRPSSDHLWMESHDEAPPPMLCSRDYQYSTAPNQAQQQSVASRLEECAPFTDPYDVSMRVHLHHISNSPSAQHVYYHSKQPSGPTPTDQSSFSQQQSSFSDLQQHRAPGSFSATSGLVRLPQSSSGPHFAELYRQQLGCWSQDINTDLPHFFPTPEMFYGRLPAVEASKSPVSQQPDISWRHTGDTHPTFDGSRESNVLGNLSVDNSWVQALPAPEVERVFTSCDGIATRESGSFTSPTIQYESVDSHAPSDQWSVQGLSGLLTTASDGSQCRNAALTPTPSTATADRSHDQSQSDASPLSRTPVRSTDSYGLTPQLVSSPASSFC